MEGETRLYGHPGSPLTSGPSARFATGWATNQQGYRSINHNEQINKQQPKQKALQMLPGMQPEVLYEYDGVGLLYRVSGAVPLFAIFDRPESLKLVISTFNTESKVDNDENDNGIEIYLVSHERKRNKAVVFSSSIDDPRAHAGVPSETRLKLSLSHKFDDQRVMVSQSKTRLKIILPKKKVGTRVQINRVRGD